METKLHRERRLEGEQYEQWVVDRWPLVYGKTLTRVRDKNGQYKYGDTMEGVEIKNDKLIDTYGHVYIEMEEKANEENPEYVTSGIYSNDTTRWLCIGDKKRWWIFEKTALRELDAQDPEWLKRPKPTGTSIGFCIPVERAMELCLRYQEFDEDENPKDDSWLNECF